MMWVYLPPSPPDLEAAVDEELGDDVEGLAEEGSDEDPLQQAEV